MRGAFNCFRPLALLALKRAVTTVTFEEDDGKTLVTLHERYPTEAALDDAIAGSAEGLPEQFAQLDALLAGES